MIEEQRPTIVFIHGLNTYGDDDVHIGPLRFGRMHANIERAFDERGVRVVSLGGLGTGSPVEQAMRASQVLKSRNLPARFHLLGQSTGGLVARVLAASPEWQIRIGTIFTVGTPHAGTLAARFGLEFADHYPALCRLFTMFGYDTRAKGEIFRHFTEDRLAEFNQKFPGTPTVREISVICEVPREKLSWPLAIFHSRLNPTLQPSDGFIWSASQKRGEQWGPFALDHFSELGFFPHLSAGRRQEARAEFLRMIDAIVRHVK